MCDRRSYRMKAIRRLGLLGVSAALLMGQTAEAQRYADEVIDYRAGEGFATEFGSGLGYTNALAALGAPARETPGPFGGPVDPLNPPYLREQLLSLGAGGSVTLGFSTLIRNDSANPFQLDFVLFGNSGFVITNGDFTGGGVTDGSLFSQATGQTQVSVSEDGQRFFVLDRAKAPLVDDYFPTDGQGDFALPVNPALAATAFGGLGLDGIRGLYAGSGGGTGFDLSWARDGDGQPVTLETARYVRVDVLSGHAEIDAVAVVPEPPVWALGGVAIALGLMANLRRSKGNCVQAMALKAIAGGGSANRAGDPAGRL